MLKKILVFSIFLYLVLFIEVFAQGFIDIQNLYNLREKINSNQYKDTVKKLKREADKLLDMKPVSVTQKSQIPPSGDKHDYMSLAPYWWPDPSKPDGLPYIRKDGEVNPERDKIPDKENLNKMINAVFRLSIAYFLLQDEAYSKKAVELMQTWFLDEKTKMNPNLNYAQAVPGRNEGRGAGIIDAHRIYLLINALNLLKTSKNFDDIKNNKIKEWFSEYLKWLIESDNGRKESEALNNHGTWYYVQVIYIAKFLENKDFLIKSLDELKNLLNLQISQDGSQPKELVRTKSLHYSYFNLEAHFVAAHLAETVGVDLWHYTTEDGRNLKKAFDYLLPFAFGELKWPYEQIEEFEFEKIYPLLLIAQKKFNDTKYENYLEKYFKHKTENEYLNLLLK